MSFYGVQKDVTFSTQWRSSIYELHSFQEKYCRPE